MAARTVAVVPHTHWDREWYEPFQTFRLRLVDTLDALLDLLEADPSYSRFLLDGQVAVVDDYLEVRPEHVGRLRRLVAAGRLAIGPWYILMDEFLVSGETLVRDLQLGIERGAAYGGTADVGYLSRALQIFYGEQSASALDRYSDLCLRRVWKAERFSWWFTSLMHRFPDTGEFGQKIQEAELDYLVHSRAASTSLAENYVGLPLEDF